MKPLSARLRNLLLRNLIVRNGVLGALGLVASTLVVLVATPLLLHRLGAAQYGIWALATTALGAANFANAGLGTALGKFVAEHWAQDDGEGLAKTLTAGLLLGLVVGVALALLLVLVAPLASLVIKTGPGQADELSSVVRIAAVGVVGAILGSFANAVPVGLQRYGIVSATGVLQTLLSWLFALGVAVAGGGIQGVVWSSVVALWVIVIARAIVAGVLLRKWPVRPSLSMSHTWGVARYAFLSSVSGVGGQIFDSMDRVAVGIVLGTSSLAYYSILAGAASRINQFTSAFWRPLMPASSALQAQRDRQRLWSYLFWSSVTCLAMNSAIVIVLVGGSTWLLTAWLGPSTAQITLWPFRILVCTYAAFSLAGPGFNMANGIGAPGIGAATAIIGGVLTIVIIVVLSPALHLVGAALGNAGYLVILIIPLYMARILRRGRHEFPLGTAAAGRRDV